MKSIIVGTAGHIDHGKTALVRALTGIDADRLPEEKRRGITIDIGFADLDLGDVRVGFVDVPGHERFVKNMLAGAHGIDAVALIIAADESVMPQTREHFDICQLLGVRQGLIVLTKKDLVDEELLDLARDEAEELVKGSFLEGAPVLAVSSRTGEGITEVKDTLRQIASQVAPRSAEYVVRLPVDRAFTMHGFGAVVTGTLIAGEVSEGDELELLPAGMRVRVRGLQVHGAPVKTAFAGQRTAINLAGIDTANIERGMVLAQPGRLRPTQIIDARVRVLADSPRALISRQRVRVHIGAAEALARVRVLAPRSGTPADASRNSRNAIEPGAEGFIQLSFESPVVGVLGDRFIVRAYSPQLTIGGGRILDPFAGKHRARDLPAVHSALQNLAAGNNVEQLTQFALNAGRRGLTVADLAARTGRHDEVIKGEVAEAAAAGSIVDLGTSVYSGEVFKELKDRVVDEIAAYHKREPLSRGIAKEVVRERFFSGATSESFREVLARFESDGAFVSEKEILRLPQHTRELSREDAQLQKKLEHIYEAAGVAPPALAVALAAAGVNTTAQHARKILQLLLDSGMLVRVQGEMLFHRRALDELAARLRSYAATRPDRTVDVGQFKELAGISRKYAIPLLEHFDRERVTRREGDRRVVL